MGQTITTRYGAIDLTIQDGRTAYVRVGSGDRDDTTGADARLELPRGAQAYGRAHFKHDADGWAVLEPASTYGLRRAHPDSRFPRDLTPTMADAAHDAIADALAESVDVDALDDAQYAKNTADAAERREQATALVRMADQLNRQATELELDRGARVAYLTQRLQSGTSQDATAVRTSSGDLLFVDSPRPYVGFVNDRGLRQYVDESAAWTER